MTGQTTNDARTSPHLPCLSSMRRSTYPLKEGRSAFHRYEFQVLHCHETRRRTQSDLIEHIEAELMRPLPGFQFGSRERISYANERERFDIYLRHDSEGREEALIETVEHFPEVRWNLL